MCSRPEDRRQSRMRVTNSDNGCCKLDASREGGLHAKAGRPVCGIIEPYVERATQNTESQAMVDVLPDIARSELQQVSTCIYPVVDCKIVALSFEPDAVNRTRIEQQVIRTRPGLKAEATQTCGLHSIQARDSQATDLRASSVDEWESTDIPLRICKSAGSGIWMERWRLDQHGGHINNPVSQPEGRDSGVFNLKWPVSCGKKGAKRVPEKIICQSETAVHVAQSVQEKADAPEKVESKK
ncbi:hypothetical protein B0H21DRAFT_882943 [Amylocystis lapponica]|nr:hypothetical protein B0H21DRAFT_882943 [Amylocystis lapponica]